MDTGPFENARRFGIVAGSGTLPVEVATAIAARGGSPFIVTIAGEADPADFADFDHVEFRIGDFGPIIDAMVEAGVSHAVLAGGIAARPRLRDLRLGHHLIRLVPRVIAARVLGDNAILSEIVRYLETVGLVIVGAHEVVPELLAPSGSLTKKKPTKADWLDIEAGAAAARAIGALDIGQAAIAVGGRVIALEGVEGTDGLLERAAALRNHGRVAGMTRGVLVKCVKPGQEMRADLPSIGPATVAAAKKAGLVGIAVDAGRSLVLEAGRTIADADRHGLFVVGLEAGEQP